MFSEQITSMVSRQKYGKAMHLFIKTISDDLSVKAFDSALTCLHSICASSYIISGNARAVPVLKTGYPFIAISKDTIIEYKCDPEIQELINKIAKYRMEYISIQIKKKVGI